MIEIGCTVKSTYADASEGRTGKVVYVSPQGQVGIDFGPGYPGHECRIKNNEPSASGAPLLKGDTCWWVPRSYVQVIGYPPQLKDPMFSLEEITSCP